MRVDLDEVLEDRWAEYERLHAHGEVYSATLRLAEVKNCLEHQVLPKPARRKWEAKVREAESSLHDMDLVVAGVDSAVERLQHMLGIGVDFTYEELVLLITIRVELDVVLDYLATLGLAEQDRSEIAEVDADLLSVARSASHRSLFLSAQAAARRNWGIPLETRWLSASLC